MLSLIWFISIAAFVAVTSSASIGYLEEPVPRNVLESLVEASNLYAPSELARWKKSIYEAPSLPAPPCPKSYLFSCQPNLAPVPCAPAPAPAYAPAPAPAPAYAPAPAPAPTKPSHAGAYSIPVPSYSYPQGIPQQLLMPAYGYNQYLY